MTIHVRVLLGSVEQTSTVLKGKIFRTHVAVSVTILTGQHGGEHGESLPHKPFFLEDNATWGADKNVSVVDITKLNKKEIKETLNSDDTIVCGWCFSDVSKKVEPALKETLSSKIWNTLSGNDNLEFEDFYTPPKYHPSGVPSWLLK